MGHNHERIFPTPPCGKRDIRRGASFSALRICIYTTSAMGACRGCPRWKNDAAGRKLLGPSELARLAEIYLRATGDKWTVWARFDKIAPPEDVKKQAHE